MSITDDINHVNWGAFDDYQLYAEDTAIYPHKKEMLGLVYAVLGLANEAGEVAGKLKKILRDKGGVLSEDDIKALSKEIGDVQWYMAATCSELGLDLGEVARENLMKLFDRKDRGVIGGSGDNR